MYAIAENHLDQVATKPVAPAAELPTTDYRLRIINSLQEFAGLKSAWSALTTEPLRSFEWHYAWWTAMGGDSQLQLYCLEQDGQTVGIAPFYRDHWFGQSRLRFIGSGQTCTDYAQLICAPGILGDFVDAIANAITATGSLQMLELEGVCGRDPVWDFQRALSPSFWSYQSELEPTWVLDLPTSWAEFIKASRSSLRRKIRKAQDRISASNCSVQSTLDGLPFEEAFQSLVDLHQLRFVSKGEKGVFCNAKFTTFLRTATEVLCRDGRAEIIVISVDGRALVAGLYLLGSRGPQFYQSGLDIGRLDLEPGHLMFSFVVKRAVENGYTEFDFLRGNEPYKAFWGAEVRALSNVRLVARQAMPSAINRTFLALRNMKHRGGAWYATCKRKP